MPALYLSLNVVTAIKEANQGFGYKMEPYVLCSYDVDCEDIVNLGDDAGRAAAAMEYGERTSRARRDRRNRSQLYARRDGSRPQPGPLVLGSRPSP